MVTNTQEVHDPTDERAKAQSGGGAKAAAGAREAATFEQAPSAGAELRPEEARLRFEEVRLRLEEARLRVEVERLRVERARLYQTMQFRVLHWLIAMTTLTGLAVSDAALAAVFSNGFRLTEIPESVVITLLALPVAKMAAMFLIVVKHLFPPRRLGK